MPRFRKDPPLFVRRRMTMRQKEQATIGILVIFVVVLLAGVCG